LNASGPLQAFIIRDLVRVLRPGSRRRGRVGLRLHDGPM
jgi:hypothetical protein